MQWLLEAIFWHANSRFSTVPLYAVLDAGFDAYTVDGRAVPAGLQIRRAHRRPLLGNELPESGSPEEFIKAEVEMLLRHYGLTSCKQGTRLEITQDHGSLALRYGGHPTWLPDEPSRQMLRMLAGIAADWEGTLSVEGINVQLTREVGLEPAQAQLIDFGQYTFRDRFSLPALNLIGHRPLMWGSTLSPDSPLYPQPDPDLLIDSTGWHGAKSWNLCAAYRAGEITGDDLQAEMLAFVNKVAAKWHPTYPASASASKDQRDAAGACAAERAHLAGAVFANESRRLQGLVDQLQAKIFAGGFVAPELRS